MSNLYKSITVSLTKANAQTDEDSVFMTPSVGIANVTRIAVHLASKSGTAYTTDSLSVELFQVENTDSTTPVSAGPESFYKRTGCEPAAVASGGQVFDDSDFSQPLEIANQTAGQNGTISVRLKRTGGAADSAESYEVQVWGYD